MSKPKRIDGRARNGVHTQDPNRRKCEATTDAGKPCQAPVMKTGPLCFPHQQRADNKAAKEAKATPIVIKSTADTLKAMEGEDIADEEGIKYAKRYLCGVFMGTTTETIQTSQGQIIEREAMTKDKLTAIRIYHTMCVVESIDDEIDLMTPQERKLHLIGLLG